MVALFILMAYTQIGLARTQGAPAEGEYGTGAVAIAFKSREASGTVPWWRRLLNVVAYAATQLRPSKCQATVNTLVGDQ